MFICLHKNMSLLRLFTLLMVIQRTTTTVDTTLVSNKKFETVSETPVLFGDVLSWVLHYLRSRGIIPPETGLNAYGLIKYYGYPLEIHTTITEDGYILEIHRIPHGRNQTVAAKKKKSVVILMPGLFSNSAVFLTNGFEKSLGFMLADLGYDVWIGNSRGTTFSRSHVSVDPKMEPARFFNFSLTELGIYDLPAHIDYVLNATGDQSLLYIGHSQGTTDFFIMASEKPEYNKKIKLAVALAPTAFLGHMKSYFYVIIAILQIYIQKVLNLVGIYELLFHNEFFTLLAAVLCNNYSPLQTLCADAFFLFGGRDRSQFNQTLIPIIMSNLPAGASVKEVVHYAQFVNTPGTFAYFDYGDHNVQVYGQKMPPEYKIENIDCPVALYYAVNDMLSSPTDVQILTKKLKNVVVHEEVAYDKFSHLDFLWAKDLNQLVNDHIIKLLGKYAM